MKQDKKDNWLFFRKNRGKTEVYLWTKKSYEDHYNQYRHDIAFPEGLKKIDLTIRYPDCITTGKQVGQKNFYKVFTKHTSRQAISVWYYKVVCFRDKKRNFYFIATAFNSTTVNYLVVNQLERVKWRKKNSLI